MKQRSIYILWVLLFAGGSLTAQDRFFTKAGEIAFYSKAPLESIEAFNKNATCVLDTKTGNIQFVVLMKGFAFQKALMQEHFNENYVESDKFPKSEFKGQLINNTDIIYSKDGSYPAKVKGKLTIHGETHDVEAGGIITVIGGKMRISSDFIILLSDYKITIPGIMTDKISKSVKISVACSLDPLKTS